MHSATFDASPSPTMISDALTFCKTLARLVRMTPYGGEVSDPVALAPPQQGYALTLTLYLNDAGHDALTRTLIYQKDWEEGEIRELFGRLYVYLYRIQTRPQSSPHQTAQFRNVKTTTHESARETSPDTDSDSTREGLQGPESASLTSLKTTSGVVNWTGEGPSDSQHTTPDQTQRKTQVMNLDAIEFNMRHHERTTPREIVASGGSILKRELKRTLTTSTTSSTRHPGPQKTGVSGSSFTGLQLTTQRLNVADVERHIRQELKTMPGIQEGHEHMATANLMPTTPQERLRMVMRHTPNWRYELIKIKENESGQLKDAVQVTIGAKAGFPQRCLNMDFEHFMNDPFKALAYLNEQLD